MAQTGSDFYDAINRDIRALDASILMLSQKMNYVVRNEKILSRNLIVLNKKIADIESRVSGGTGEGGIGTAGSDAAAIQDKLDALSSTILRIEARLSGLEKAIGNGNGTGKYATKDEMKEVKYLLDMLSPLGENRAEKRKKR